MSERTIGQEWRDANDATNYPFSSRATLRNAAGDQIMQGTFIDASIFAAGLTADTYLSAVEITGLTGVIRIGTVVSPKLLSGSFDLTAPIPTEVRLSDAYGRAAGLLVSDAQRLASLAGWAPGVHAFRREQTEFCARCVTPITETGVRALVVNNQLLAGSVGLQAGPGLRFTGRTEILPTGGMCSETGEFRVIRVDFVGDPLFRRAACEEAGEFVTPRFIREIRFRVGDQVFRCTPDEYGNFSLFLGRNEAEQTLLRLRIENGDLLFEAVGSQLKEVSGG